MIIQTVLDVQADNIVMSLIDEQVFQQIGGDYLAVRAHPETRDYFLHLFRQQGYQKLATTIEKAAGQAAPEPAARPLACAVDDSRMILKIYRNILYELGYEPVLFEFPAAALEWLEEKKPAVLFTDLNMPEITGIELVEKARQCYPREELPIIMVTTQNEMQDNEAALAAGVNDILAKPFTAETLQAAIEKNR